MSARASSAGSSSNETVAPPKRCGQRERALAPAVGDEHRARRRARAARCAVSSAVSPAPMISTWRSARSPSASRASVDGDGGDAGAARARSRSPCARACRSASAARNSRLVSGPVVPRGERELVGALDLALDLGLADDHRLEARWPRGTGGARRRSCAASRCPRAARSGGCPARRASAAEHGGLGLDRVADDEVELGAVAGRDARPPPGSPARSRSSRSEALAPPRRSARAARAARRGAVLCEAPSASSSLIAAPSLALARSARALRSASSASSTSSRSMRASFDGHDRHVDQDQRQEHEVGGRDVVPGVVERERGHQDQMLRLRGGGAGERAGGVVAGEARA